jgi:hypothetical protein
MVYTRTTADANIGGEGWDVFGYGGAIEVKDMNLPSGDPNIRGQMKPFQSELYFRPKASGAPNYNVVAPAINYVASLTAVDSTSTISQWVGVYIDSPCSECGATDKVTTGYGIWVDDLDESTHTLVKANAAAIKLSGLNEYGRILWTNCSAYCPSSGTLEFKAGTAVQTASGVNFNVGGGYRVGGTEVISSGRVADFASLKIGGTQVIDSNRGLTNLQGASVNDAASPGSGAFQLGSSFSGSPKISMNTSNGNIGTLGVVNAVNGFQFNSTPGATGTFLDQNGNTVHVNGGIITSLT